MGTEASPYGVARCADSDARERRSQLRHARGTSASSASQNVRVAVPVLAPMQRHEHRRARGPHACSPASGRAAVAGCRCRCCRPVNRAPARCLRAQMMHGRCARREVQIRVRAISRRNHSSGKGSRRRIRAKPRLDVTDECSRRHASPRAAAYAVSVSPCTMTTIGPDIARQPRASRRRMMPHDVIRLGDRRQCLELDVTLDAELGKRGVRPRDADRC